MHRVAVAILVMCLSPLALAVPVTINLTNPSFESPGTGSWSTNDAPGWAPLGTGPHAYGVTIFNHLAPSGAGSQMGYLNTATSLAQSIDEPLQADTRYTLTALLARRTDNAHGVARLSLRLLSGADLVVSQPIHAPTGDWQRYSVSFDVPSTGPLVGSAFQVVITREYEAVLPSQVNFDDVTLTRQAIPEPTGLAAVAGSVLLLARRRRVILER